MNFKKYHVSRNLFDKSSTVIYYAYFNDSNQWIASDDSRSIVIPVNGGTQYTLSVPEALTVFRICEATQEPVIGNTYSRIVRASSAIDRYTFITQNDTKYIIFQGGRASVDTWFNGLMLNSGSEALPYEPYDNSWHDIPHYIHKTDTDTITTLPAVIYPNNTTATVGLKGQMVQNGTPTPDNPVMPQGCGERTGNLFDKDATNANNGYISNGYLRSDGNISTNIDYRVSEYIRISQNQPYILYYGSNLNLPSVCFYDSSKNYISGVAYSGRWDVPFTTPQNAEYLRLSFRAVDVDNIKLNEGSTALPYEPYGYKLDISSANTTTPVYLGEVETTRRVKKLVLTGQENWNAYTSIADCYRLDIRTNPGITGNGICSHYATVESTAQLIDGAFVSGQNYSYFKDVTAQNLDGWKSYLAAQYAAGTPVCIWYVLATPETAVVNEPLMKIGDYADSISGITIPVTAGANTLSVDTTVQPSEVTVNYKGWHPVQNVHEKSKNLFINEWEQGSIDPSGTDYPSDTVVRTKNYIPVTPNTIYSISRNIAASYINLRFYNGNKQFIDRGTSSTIRLISGNTEANPMGVGIGFCCFEIIDSNIRYMRINDNSNDTSTKYMMVEGQYTASTIPVYEPYWT